MGHHRVPQPLFSGELWKFLEQSDLIKTFQDNNWKPLKTHCITILQNSEYSTTKQPVEYEKA